MTDATAVAMRVARQGGRLAAPMTWATAVPAAVLLRLIYSSGRMRRIAIGLAILALRTLAPAACVYAVSDMASFVARSRGAGGLSRILRRMLTVWAMAEACFVPYYMWYRRKFTAQTTRRWQAVNTHSTEERRRMSLERYLLALAQVCQGAAPESDNPADPAQEGEATDGPAKGARLGYALAGNGGLAGPGGLGRPKGFGPGLGNLAGGGFSNGRKGLSMMGTSLTDLRRQSDTAFLVSHRRSGSGGTLKSQTSQGSLANASVDDLLKMWEVGGDSGAMSHASHEEVVLMKRLELSAWFTGEGLGDHEDPVEWLRRGNVEEWIAHYWFRGATPGELAAASPKQGEELRKLVSLVLASADLEEMPEGRNDRIRPFLLFRDPLPSLHRPLLLYAGSSLVCPVVTGQVMWWLGFRRGRVGGLLYWTRKKRSDVPKDLDITTSRQSPAVICHGLGLGLVPYFLFIKRFSERHSGEIFVPEFPFLAMAPWESVPSAREVVAQLQDMLAANRHTAAHFVGHSFGAVIIGWMLKMSPSSVVCMTLMEPASILMLKSDMLTKCLFAETKTCYEMLIRYFAFRELFTVNLLCRNLFWEQSVLWPEDIQVPCFVQLAGADHIVQSRFVKRLLEHERSDRKQKRRVALKRQRRPNIPISGSSLDVRSDPLHPLAQEQARDADPAALELLVLDNFFHGQILFDGRGTEKLFNRMRQVTQAV